jgi:transcriptional regulator of acetoin/glycerol metabolism
MGLYSDYEININIELQNRNKAAWEEIFATKVKTLDSMPSTEIFDGWRRSAAYGLDPFTKSAKRVVSPDELKDLREKNAFFLNVSQPMLENINNFVYDSGFNVAISDRNGIILIVMGDSLAVNSTRAGNWIAGADWSESSIGNNGIGTCLHLYKPVMMIGYEHYCRCCHYFASAVAPIHDENGVMLGCIALCGRFEKIHAHTLGLVIAAAKAIEIQLKINRALKEKEKANIYQEMIFNSINDGIISTDRNGVIRFCNRRCAKLLRLNHAELIGKNIDALFDAANSRLLLDPAQKLQDKVVSINLGDRLVKCMCTSQHIMGTGRFDGIVIALRDYDQMVQVAKRIVKIRPKWMFQDIIGRNKEFLEVLRIARLAADTSSNVFILGESGTGKDVLAQAIHNEGPNANAPFVALNCGAIPKELIASELFGYGDGAFTGAKKGGQAGKFELAKGGAVFLDEIGEMPLEQQVVLLRVLDESTFTRIGSSERISVSAKIIAATNKDINKAIQDGVFRQDLFFRLNVFSLTTVPLRRRLDDIEELANVFLKKIAENCERKHAPINSEVLDFLTAYNWPGNIRELQNVLERAFFMSPDGVLRAETLRLNNLLPQNRPAPSSPAIPGSRLKDKRAAYEAELLAQDLERNKWNISQTCNYLNVSRSTLYRWMKKYNLNSKPRV